jgi:hypothetical protein
LTGPLAGALLVLPARRCRSIGPLRRLVLNWTEESSVNESFSTSASLPPDFPIPATTRFAGDKVIFELEVIGVKGPRLYALCRGEVVGDRPSGRLGCRGDWVGDFRMELREVDDLDLGDLPGLTGVEADGAVLE